jgi:hypothetical protein
VKELPGIFHAIAEQLRSGAAGAAMQYYAEFVSQSLTKAGSHTPEDLLPNLHRMCISDLPPESDGNTALSAASSQSTDHPGPTTLSDTATSSRQSASGPKQQPIQQEDHQQSSGPIEISWDVDLAADEDAGEASGFADIDWDVDMTGAEAADPDGMTQSEWGIHIDGHNPDAMPESTGEFMLISQILLKAMSCQSGAAMHQTFFLQRH